MNWLLNGRFALDSGTFLVIHKLLKSVLKLARVKKSMFAYAHAGENACNNLGCVCYFEVLTKDGKCKQGTTYDKSYDLYTII